MKIRNLALSCSFALAVPLLLAAGIPAAQAAATSAAAAPVSIRHATPFSIRTTVIGEGAPKTIVPTTGASVEQVLQQAKVIGDNADADIIEFRIDYLDFASDAAKVAALGKQVAEAVHHKPLILTFRTKTEGGTKAIADADYGKLYLALIQGGFIDMLDVEMFRDPQVVSQVVAAAHKAGIKIVMSSHDFQKTPDTAEIVARLRKQDTLGADVLKIAVMPHDTADVLKLLDASAQIRAKYSDKPLLVMSMGGVGAITRLSGEVFGSDMTFGMIGVPSAPGQVDVKQLRQVLDVIHASVTGGK